VTRDVVDPSLPNGIVGSFDGSQPMVGGMTVAYPSPGVILPHDLAPIDVQWNPPAGSNVYRVTYDVETGDRLRGFVKGADWIPTASDWQWLLDRAAGHKLTVDVAGGSMDPSGALTKVVSSTALPLQVSRDDATGALFYFATTGDQTTGDGTLERLPVGAQKPDKYLNKTNDGGRCVGCHQLTRDGTHLAFAYYDIGGGLGGTSQTLGLVDASDPTKGLAGAGQNMAQATFNPDGTKMVTQYGGKMTLRDGLTGASIMDITTSGAALYPDWSPDGSKLVFVKPSAGCQQQILDIGQTSIFVYGGSLTTLDWNGSTFSNEQTILAAQGTDNNYYPSWSPDGGYIAFTRADGTVKSTWSLAGMACTGHDGSGLSYDNPSATLWLLPAKGGAPFQLTAANGAPMKTNSWPRWAPKADGEYLWMSFSSTRAYGNVLAGANAHHQIWFTAIAPIGKVEVGANDPSAPAVWFPFQDTVTKNHIGTWSLQVGNYSIM
jgi:hypothetical protein